MRTGLSGCLLVGLLLCAALVSEAAAATSCQTQSFERWLDGVRQEAAAQGVSPRALAALNGLVFDPSVVRRDHGQGVFQQGFLQFSDRMAAAFRIQGGSAAIKRHADLFARIEKDYGVPAPVIAAYWGLESGFGADNGKYPILRAIATLAYDCRRPQYFRAQLIDALRIIQRGDLRASEMIGAWAGELGPLQFTPSDYYKYAVDYDGDGRRDLIHSVPDVLASGANFLAAMGWKRGEP
jgi:lytic murein transglycosylase